MLTEKNVVADIIRSGETLMLSGTEEMLTGLPNGNWVGGTSSYFMNENGGQKNTDKIFVMKLPTGVKLEQVKFYDSEHLADISKESPDNGFTYLLMPFGTKAHLNYAEKAPFFPGQFTKIIIGWVAGVALEDLRKKTTKVFNGQNGQISEMDVLAMHCSLPKNKYAMISTINIYEADKKATIVFPNSGFEASFCLINGEPTNIVKYMRENNIDIKHPIVTNFRFGSTISKRLDTSGYTSFTEYGHPSTTEHGGNYVNVSFAGIEGDKALLYAPIFSDVKYYFAKPADYLTQFNKHSTAFSDEQAFSFNCILNYTNSNLEGKVTKGMYGPFTFGEIAYQLLNQTLVYLDIKSKG
jgi:hypothetical protein